MSNEWWNFKNHHLTTVLVIIVVSGKNHLSVHAKTSGWKFDESICFSLFIVKKHDRHHLNQVTEVITRNQTSRNHLYPDTMHWEEYHFWSIPVKNVLLESNNKKTSNSNQGTF